MNFFLNVKGNRWQVTSDRWHVTLDMWHVTRDTWHMTHYVGWTFSQNFISLAITVWDLWSCEYLQEKDHWLTDWLTDYGLCRTALATLGLLKLDGVGPVDYRPSTDQLHHFVTGYRWHVTHDILHMSRDTWHMTHGVGWTFSQNFSSLALLVWDWQYLELKDEWMNEWMN